MAGCFPNAITNAANQPAFPTDSRSMQQFPVSNIPCQLLTGCWRQYPRPHLVANRTSSPTLLQKGAFSNEQDPKNIVKMCPTWMWVLFMNRSHTRRSNGHPIATAPQIREPLPSSPRNLMTILAPRLAPTRARGADGRRDLMSDSTARMSSVHPAL